MTKTILILAANPKDTSRLRLDQEVREIDNGLQRARRRDEFTLKQVWAVRRSDFRRAMLDTAPNIVHFCGHGSGEEGIAFEDENGQANLISTEGLSSFFELFADTVECVVLNACYSEVQAEAIAKHIPHVIGMNKAIGDTAAIEFAVAFYDALGAGKTIEFAYKLACNAIQLSSIPENLTPILTSKKEHRSLSETVVQSVAPDLWVVQECKVDVFRNESDLGGMHDPAWRIGQRVRIGLIYLGHVPLYALSAEQKSAEGVERNMVRLGEHHGLGSVTSITTVNPGETCNLFVFPENDVGSHSFILLRWVTPDGIQRRAELALSTAGGAATVAPTRFVGEDVSHSEVK